jgi:2-polyprenyl-3-methyl-5-hydroxy-6-metoxy-1,4-benzoquinol methylase
MTASTESGYLLNNNRRSEAGSRFDSLAALFNPVTIRHFDALGVSSGWQCREVGAGGPSLPLWLSSRVGPSGRVVATDIDVSWVQEIACGNIDVRQHDVAAESAPGRFDLVHARLVLVHVPDREEALRRMVDSLRPGGWLLLEDFDPNMQPLACVDVIGPAQLRANRIRRGFLSLLPDAVSTSSSGANCRGSCAKWVWWTWSPTASSRRRCPRARNSRSRT